MIISISGYAGSGKDLVGNIIRYLGTNKSDISYSGSYNSWVMDEGMGGNHYSRWTIKKWATKVKEIASLLTGIPIEKFEEQEFKKVELGTEWWTKDWNQNLNEIPGVGKIYKDIPMTVREFLQRLGTDAIRDKLHENTWINALIHEYKPPYPDWVITDTRFPNELEAVKDKGVSIWVERPGVKPINNHPSETSLDGYKFDYTIKNEGSIEELIEKVKEVYDRI